MKIYVVFILLLTFSKGYCQSKSGIFSDMLNRIPTSLFETNQHRSTKVFNHQVLLKTTFTSNFNNNKVALLPKNYSWNSDIRRIESIKIMALNIRQQDFCGRDFLIDSHSEALQNLHLKSMLVP
jgi:hypothetical protein